MVKISAVIITYNEEKNIRRCLESLKNIADEIVIVDSFSLDKTEEICAEFNVKFNKQAFLGYGEQKNLGNSIASNDYILSLDADEALSEELIQSILMVKANWQYDAYELTRLNNYCGKWIKHGGWYPDRKIRLFDRRKGGWEGQLVHERLVLNQSHSIGFLEGKLLHYSYYSISEHITQMNKYSELGAQELFKKGKSVNYITLLIKTKFKFFRNFILKGGILDGFYGLVIAYISAAETFLKYAKLIDLRKKH
jgi:glycosyltransferase involved in cell wall biosynthesis